MKNKKAKNLEQHKQEDKNTTKKESAQQKNYLKHQSIKR